jgi:hypothetical protein
MTGPRWKRCCDWAILRVVHQSEAARSSRCGPKTARNSPKLRLRTSSRILSMRSRATTMRACEIAAITAVVFVGAAARAAQSDRESGPFSVLYGTWSGAGVIKRSNGTSERIRCRSTDERAGTTSLHLRLRCASDSYNFDLTATVIDDGGPISGVWSETTRNANGSLQGRSSGNGRQVQAVAKGPAFTANLTLTTRGNKQSILILSPGTEVPEVTITLDKQ